MRALLLIMLLFNLVSCNQVGLGVGSAVKNFFTTPIKAVEGLISGADYEDKKEETIKNKKNSSETVMEYCLDEAGQPVDKSELSSIDLLQKNIRTLACKCQPWGDCPTNICSCGIQCPTGFDIFKHPGDMTPKKLSTPENGLSFRNGYVPSKHSQTQGYCWGHARVTSQFNRLGFFKPGVKPPHNIWSRDSEEQDNAIEYYKKIIDQVSNNKAVDIPGFPDLKTMSEHPALQSYIADKVAQTWADHAMSWQGVKTAIGTGQKSNADYKKIFSEVKERLDMNMQPTIVFTARGSNFLTHAVLVSHYEVLNNGDIALCLRDNNNPERNAASCADRMTINPTQGLVYSDPMFGKIGDINIAHNDKSDASAQADALREKCLKEKDCPLK